MNLYKESIFNFYFKMPFKRAIKGIYRIWNHINGRWYCDRCNKYHSRRTVRYSGDVSVSRVALRRIQSCYKNVAPDETWFNYSMHLGNRDITGEVRKEIENQNDKPPKNNSHAH